MSLFLGNASYHKKESDFVNVRSSNGSVMYVFMTDFLCKWAYPDKLSAWNRYYNHK